MKLEYSNANKLAGTTKTECTHITPNSVIRDTKMQEALKRFHALPYYLLCK